MTLGRCPLSIFCSRGTTPALYRLCIVHLSYFWSMNLVFIVHMSCTYQVASCIYRMYRVYIMYLSCVYRVLIVYIYCIYRMYRVLIAYRVHLVYLSCMYRVFIVYVSCINFVVLYNKSCIYLVFILHTSCVYLYCMLQVVGVFTLDMRVAALVPEKVHPPTQPLRLTA